jgi:hypothetical protein
MDSTHPSPPWMAGAAPVETRGTRRHRFMESADINAAFRLLFNPLRDNVRRGMACDGQTYGIEMDPARPGRMVGSVWIPPASRGIPTPAVLDDARRRRALYDRLLGEAQPYALYAYLCERPAAGRRSPTLYLEVVGEDAAFAAAYPIRPGRAWHQRELLRTRQRRIDLRTLA